VLGYVMTKLSESGKPTTAGQKPKHKGASRRSLKKCIGYLLVLMKTVFENRGYTTSPSICVRMSSSMDPPAPVATSAAPSQVGDTVQSFGFQSPVVVSQFSHGLPPLVHASDTQEFPCTAQIWPMTPLGPIWLQGAHLGVGQTPRTWPAFHSSFQAAAHIHVFSCTPTCI